MAKTKVVTVRDVDYTLQLPSVRWYVKVHDRYSLLGGGKADHDGYWNDLIKTVVVSPPEVRELGVEYFDGQESIGALLELVKEIESFCSE